MIQLEYHRPVPKRRRFSLVSDDAWVNYWYGAMIGCAILARSAEGPPVNRIATFIEFAIAATLTAIPSALLFAIRVRTGPTAWRSVAQPVFVVALLITFYPAAHLLFCKTMAAVRDDENFVCRVSPLIIFCPWLIGGLVIYALTRKRQPPGESRLHWLLSGFSWPFATASLLEGTQYLYYSYDGGGWDNLNPIEVITVAFAYPLIFALCFTDIARWKPTAAEIDAIDVQNLTYSETPS